MVWKWYAMKKKKAMQLSNIKKRRFLEEEEKYDREEEIKKKLFIGSIKTYERNIWMKEQAERMPTSWRRKLKKNEMKTHRSIAKAAETRNIERRKSGDRELAWKRSCKRRCEGALAEGWQKKQLLMKKREEAKYHQLSNRSTSLKKLYLYLWKKKKKKKATIYVHSEEAIEEIS